MIGPILDFVGGPQYRLRLGLQAQRHRRVEGKALEFGDDEQQLRRRKNGDLCFALGQRPPLFARGGFKADQQREVQPPVGWQQGAKHPQIQIDGINIQRRFTIVFGLAAVVSGLAGVMYTPIVPPDYTLGMEFLVLSFVVVVVGGMGSLPGAVVAGFLLGILQSFASLNEIKSVIPGIDQIIIYLVAVVILLVRPRGLMGRKGVMES